MMIPVPVLFSTPEDGVSLATVTWDILDAGAEPILTWRESYNLVRTDGAWRVMASIDHVA